MSKDWVSFLLIRVPIGAIVLAAICQLAAALLDHVPMRRNRSDELAVAIQADHAPHRIVLLGDSVTRDSTWRFSLGRDQDDVVNLSTHGAIGVPGEYFILRRYLESHPPPEYVVLSMSPEVYFGIVKTERMHYYMWYTFDRAEERAFLKQYLPDIDSKDRGPAVLDPQERIVERLFGLFHRSKPALVKAMQAPDASAAVEPPALNLSDGDGERTRVSADVNSHVRSLESASLGQICRLGVQYGFQIRVIWPPVPKAVADGFSSEGVYRNLEKDIDGVLEQNGCKASYFNLNSVRVYGNFHRDGMHLLGEGWEERAASDFKNYFMSLPDRNSDRAGTGSS